MYINVHKFASVVFFLQEMNTFFSTRLHYSDLAFPVSMSGNWAEW